MTDRVSPRHAETDTRDWAALGEAARKRRQQLDMTQKDVQRAGGPQLGVVANIEQVFAPVSRASLERLAFALRWNPEVPFALLRGEQAAWDVEVDERPPWAQGLDLRLRRVEAALSALGSVMDEGI